VVKQTDMNSRSGMMLCYEFCCEKVLIF